MFQPIDTKVDFPKMEESILKLWKEKDIFHTSIREREGSPTFVFYDGPPFATGLPHFGHLVPSILKDIIPRYKSMQGFQVKRRWGWDTHGLPVEYEVEKSLNLKTKQDILSMGIQNFNERCQDIVLQHSHQWRETIERIGRWVDFNDCYTTMDKGFMESVWWVFKELFNKGLIYQGYCILPYSPKLSTPLSNFEVSLGEYKDIHDLALTIKFPVKGQENISFLAWTTTPWTLPINLGLAINPKNDYLQILVKETGEEFILGKSRISSFFTEGSYKISKEYKGEELKNLTYLSPFDYYEKERENGGFGIHLTNYVNDTDGTGVMHVAPFGEEDFNLLKKTKVRIPCPIDDNCVFTKEISELKGLFVKDADKEIIQLLTKKGVIFKKETILHRYPHCYRTGFPLIYRPVASWFIKVESIKDKMIANNQKVNWYPDHLKKGRFGKWLEGAREWVISRNRFWGNPIPVWQCDKSGDFICVGSYQELESLSGQKINNIHRPFIDEITWKSPAGGTYRRVKEVLDCWFESGSMPYGQSHYPFENKSDFEKNFPAQFIAEGLDQTRGWFYTLTVLSTALLDRPAFENVIVNGLVLANDGKKMSKSLRNYTDPREIINSYGADALRLYLINSPVIRSEDLKFSSDGVRDILKTILIPFWNAYSFFIMYANIDNYTPRDLKETPSNFLDSWIISEIETISSEISEKMDSYNLAGSVEYLVYFIDILNNWYIRRSRRRFWRSKNDKDKMEAYDTLYYVIKKFITLSAPFIPFITEKIFQNLRQEKDPISIHLCNYPKKNKKFLNKDLERKMALVQKVITMGRMLRNSLNIKNRQPLAVLYLISKNDREINILKEMKDILLEELNVKAVQFKDNEENLVTYRAKANFKVLGKALGIHMQEMAEKIIQLDSHTISSLLNGEEVAVDLKGKIFYLTQENVLIERKGISSVQVVNSGSLTLAFDTTISKILFMEGLTRDLIRSIQNVRKEQGFAVLEKIILYLQGDDLWSDAVSQFSETIKSETLAIKIISEKTSRSQKLSLEGDIWLEVASLEKS